MNTKILLLHIVILLTLIEIGAAVRFNYRACSSFGYTANESALRPPSRSHALRNSTNLRDYKYKGMTFVSGKYCPNVTFGSPSAVNSLEQMRRDGVNWVAIVVTWYMTYLNSTDIQPLYEPLYSTYYTFLTEKDEDLEYIINVAHDKGMKVMLKPHIDITSESDPGIWRGDIGRAFKTDKQWAAWFQSYTQFIVKYAEMAQRLNVEMFSTSCELINASPREKEWRKVVAAVRDVYAGKLVDSANWGWLNGRGEDVDKRWWDAVDIIGIDAYYPIVPDNASATLDDYMSAWELYFPRFVNLTKTFNRPLIFSEIGYCSGVCKRNYKPNATEQTMQARHYQAVLEVFQDQDYFEGMFWWAWNSDFAFGGDNDNCISPQWKQAEDVLRKYYKAVDDPLPKPKTKALCDCTV
eukprot:TRINITY_DN2237_c0_g2_i1.p1 TRINITY_DN2237_c0_g2~~TRINITY_DN2237_c0_g2_i1.p1  ORF type:complete len:408 (-),score=62.56 TRINITY_DN2237_c0_g2_i1:167-1390(-)